MSLTFEDIYSIIESLPESETLTLVGGQALNFWAELYFHDDADFVMNYGPFTSADIDFFGGKKEIINCANIWGGKAKFNDPFDSSPNSGIVIIPLESDESLIIDFLSSVHGLTEDQILKQRIKVNYKNAEFYIIHPLHCLKSRVVNVVSLNRTDKITLNRVKIAIEVMKRRINQLVDAERKRQALRECESVFHIASDTMLGIKLFIDHKLDIFEAVPKNDRLGEMFIKRRYPQMKQFLDSKRSKKIKSIKSRGIPNEQS